MNLSNSRVLLLKGVQYPKVEKGRAHVAHGQGSKSSTSLAPRVLPRQVIPDQVSYASKLIERLDTQFSFIKTLILWDRTSRQFLWSKLLQG